MKPDNLIVDSKSTENEEVNGFLPEFSREVDEFYENHSLLLYEEPIQNENSFIKLLSNDSSEVENGVDEIGSFKLKIDDDVDLANHHTNGVSSVSSKADDSEFFHHKIYSSPRRYSMPNFKKESLVISSKKCSDGKNTIIKKNGCVKETAVTSKKKVKSITKNKKIKQLEIPDNFQMPTLHAHFKNTVNNCDMNTANYSMYNIASSSKTLTEAEKMIIADKKANLKKGIKVVKNSVTKRSLRDATSKRKKSVPHGLSIEAKSVGNEKSKAKDLDFSISDNDKAIKQGQTLRIPLTDVFKNVKDFKRDSEEKSDLFLNDSINIPSIHKKLENSGVVGNTIEKSLPKSRAERLPKSKMTARKSFKQNTGINDFFSPKIRVNSNSVNLLEDSVCSTKQDSDSKNEESLADRRPMIRKSRRSSKRINSTSSLISESSKNDEIKDKVLSTDKKVVSENSLKETTEMLTSNFLDNCEKRHTNIVDNYSDLIIKTELEIEPSLPSSDSSDINDSMISPSSENSKSSICASKPQQNSNLLQLLHKVASKKVTSTATTYQSQFIDAMFDQCSNLNFSTTVANNEIPSNEESDPIVNISLKNSNSANVDYDHSDEEKFLAIKEVKGNLNFSTTVTNNEISSNEESDPIVNISLKNSNYANVDYDHSDEEKFLAIKEVKSLAKDVIDVATYNLNSSSLTHSDNTGTLKVQSIEKSNFASEKNSRQQRPSLENSCQESPKKERDEKSTKADSLLNLNEVQSKSNEGFTGLTVKTSGFLKTLAKKVQNFEIRKNRNKSKILTPASDCEVPTIRFKSEPQLEEQSESNSDNHFHNNNVKKEKTSLTKVEADITNINQNPESPALADTGNSKSQSTEESNFANKKESRQQRHSVESSYQTRSGRKPSKPDSLPSLMEVQSKPNDCSTIIQELPKKRRGRKPSKPDSLPSSVEVQSKLDDCSTINQESPKKRRGRKPSKPDSLPSSVEVQSKLDDCSTISQESPKKRRGRKPSKPDSLPSSVEVQSKSNDCSTTNQESPKKRRGRYSSKTDSLSQVKSQSTEKSSSGLEKETRQQKHSVEKNNQNLPKKRSDRKPSKPDSLPSTIEVQNKSDDSVITNVKTSDSSKVSTKSILNFKNRKSIRSTPVECNVPKLQIKKEPGLEEQTESNSDQKTVKLRGRSTHSTISAVKNRKSGNYLEPDKTVVNSFAKSPGRKRRKSCSEAANSDYDELKTENISVRKKKVLCSAEANSDHCDGIQSDKITVNHTPKKRGRKRKESCSANPDSEHTEDSPKVKRKIKTPAKLKDSVEYIFKDHTKCMKRKKDRKESLSESDEESEPSVTNVNNFNNTSNSHGFVEINPQQNMLLNNSNVFYELCTVNPQCKILFNPASNMHMIAAPLMTQFNQPTINQQFMLSNSSSVNSNLIARNNQFANSNPVVQSQMPQFSFMQNTPNNLSILPFITCSPQNVSSVVSVPQIPQIPMPQPAQSIVTSQNPSPMFPSHNVQAQHHSEASTPSSHTSNLLSNSSVKACYSTGKKLKRSNSVSNPKESFLQMGQNNLRDNNFVHSTPLANYTNKVYNLYKSHVSPIPNQLDVSASVNQSPQTLQMNSVQQPIPNQSGQNLPVNQNVQTLQLNSVKHQGCNGIDWKTVLTKAANNKCVSTLPIVVNGSYRNYTVRQFFSNPYVMRKLNEEVMKHAELESGHVDFIPKVKFEFKESYLDEPLVQVLKEFVFTHLFPFYPFIVGKQGHELNRSLCNKGYKKYSLIVSGLFSKLLANLLSPSEMNKLTIDRLPSVFTFVGIMIIFCKYKECMKNSSNNQNLTIS